MLNEVVKTRLRSWSGIAIILFHVPFVAIGVFNLFQFGSTAIRHLNASTWPSIAGEIRAFSPDTNPREQGNQPAVIYAFVLDGHPFEGDSFKLGVTHFGSERDLAYTSGQAVEIFYDPTSPEVNTLNTDLSDDILSYLFFGVMFTLIPLFILYQYIFRGVIMENYGS